jgi:hypothetical protein
MQNGSTFYVCIYEQIRTAPGWEKKKAFLMPFEFTFKWNFKKVSDSLDPQKSSTLQMVEIYFEYSERVCKVS